MRKLKKGDMVQILRGKDSGKQGEILKVLEMKGKSGNKVIKVVVKGINVSKKSQKPNQQLNIEGGIIEIEKPIDISKVMLIDPSTNKPARVGFAFDKESGKKYRVTKKNKTRLDK